VTYARKLGVLAVLGTMLGAVGCHGDYLTGGELSTSPNRPTVASNRNLFIPIQAELFNLWSGDPARVTGIYAQEFSGAARQYAALDATYAQDPTTTNGQQQAIYSSGGLVDIVNLENQSKAQGDTLFLGIAQIMEGALMGTAADIFGDVVYSQALQHKANPKPDDQLVVYDSVQKVISAGIANLQAFHKGGTNAGPGPADLNYGGNAAQWIAMAHTLKARFYMHTGKVRPQAYAQALAEAKLGITDPSGAGDYKAAISGSQIGESNLYYQFNDYYRGDLAPGGPTIDSLLVAHNDPRRDLYFTANSSTPGDLSDFGNFVNDPTYQVPLVTYRENTLIWAEAAYRTGDQATALAKLTEEMTNAGATPPSSSLSGQALLNEILNEEYVNDFGLGEEAWMLYNRTCTPNLVPHSSVNKIPGRLFYDTGEQQTNTNLPPAGQGINGYRNPATPKSTTSDGTGAPCLGQ
jgi:hypothetical protein